MKSLLYVLLCSISLIGVSDRQLAIKLVKEKALPTWFVTFDDDRDGQVSLYEWRQHNGSLIEFKKWDRNDDGLLTVPEVIYFYKKLKEQQHE